MVFNEKEIKDIIRKHVCDTFKIPEDKVKHVNLYASRQGTAKGAIHEVQIVIDTHEGTGSPYRDRWRPPFPKEPQ